MRRDFEDELKYAALPMVNDILQVRDNLIRAAAQAFGKGLLQVEKVKGAIVLMPAAASCSRCRVKIKLAFQVMHPRLQDRLAMQFAPQSNRA